MGLDIDAYVETRTDGTWRYAGDVFPDNEFPNERHCPFDGARSYGLFGFLADVRNDSRVPAVSPERGLPDDVSAEVRYELGYADFGTSWLTVAELMAFDYDQTFTDARRTDREPEVTTVRDFLGEWYFDRLDMLVKLGPPDDVRIVFGFGG